MNEKVLYEDAKFKITDLRFDYYNDSVPIDQIKDVKVFLRVFNLTMSFVCFLVSFASLIFGNIGYLIIIIFFIWLYYSFAGYVELWIAERDGKLTKVVTASLTNATYVYSIEDTLNKAIKENKIRQEEDENFDYTETMKFRQKLKELE